MRRFLRFLPWALVVVLLVVCFLPALFLVVDEPRQCITDPLKCFSLFNYCQPMPLIIDGLSDDSERIGLTEERIQTIAESRLRVARLYEEAEALETLVSDHHLYIYVHVVGNTFSFDVGYFKKLHDVRLGIDFFAQTWVTGAIGNHSKDAGFILQGISEHLDKFIVEYLRVNEGACNGQ